MLSDRPTHHAHVFGWVVFKPSGPLRFYGNFGYCFAHKKPHRVATVLLYKLLYPNIAVWRIGDRLQISPGLRERDLVHTRYFDGETHPRNKLQATVGRYLYKAQRTLWNAVTGLGFPNNTEHKPVAMPFGKREHHNYMAAITSTREQPSEWCRWLHAEFHEDLLQHIKRKNRIRGTAALDSRLIQRLPAFVAGTSDLLA